MLVYKHYLDHVRNLTNINMPPLSNEPPEAEAETWFSPRSIRISLLSPNFLRQNLKSLCRSFRRHTVTLSSCSFLSSLKPPERIKTERKREFHYTGAPGEGH